MTITEFIFENLALIEAITFSCLGAANAYFASASMFAEKKWSQLCLRVCGLGITISVIVSGFAAGSLAAMLLGLTSSLFVIWKLVNHPREQRTNILKPSLD